jgi:hypothetical protein
MLWFVKNEVKTAEVRLYVGWENDRVLFGRRGFYTPFTSQPENPWD